MPRGRSNAKWTCRVAVQTRYGHAAWRFAAAFMPGDASDDITGIDCRLGAAFAGAHSTSRGRHRWVVPLFARKKPAQQARRVRQSTTHRTPRQHRRCRNSADTPARVDVIASRFRPRHVGLESTQSRDWSLCRSQTPNPQLQPRADYRLRLLPAPTETRSGQSPRPRCSTQYQ
jgi:hypothetical protein